MLEQQVPYGESSRKNFLEAAGLGDRLLQERNRLNKLMAETVERIQELRRNLKASRARLDKLASNESTTAAELRAEKKEVSEIQEAIEVADSRVRGFKGKINELAEPLRQSASAVCGAASEFSRAALADFRQATFLPAVKAFQEVIDGTRRNAFRQVKDQVPRISRLRADRACCPSDDRFQHAGHTQVVDPLHLRNSGPDRVRHHDRSLDLILRPSEVTR